MSNILSKTGITTGYSVDAWHITQSIDAFTGDVDYDINVSGSFTLTGSLNIDGNMYGNTLGSSSTSDNADYSLQSYYSYNSSIAGFNESDFFTLQLVKPEIDLATYTDYYIGVGESGVGSKYIGLVLPIDCFILRAYISATTQITGSSQPPSINLLIDETPLLLTDVILDYSQHYSYGIGGIYTSYLAGTRISLHIQTPLFTISPHKVTHNVILTILPYTL